MRVRDRLVGLLRFVLSALEPTEPPKAEQPLSDHDREALERLASQLELKGQRQGRVPWNYHRPRRLEDNGDLRYLIDCYGIKGALEKLAKAQHERKANQ